MTVPGKTDRFVKIADFDIIIITMLKHAIHFEVRIMIAYTVLEKRTSRYGSQKITLADNG